MAPKAVNARKRIDRNERFRGHGPLLQKHRSFHGGRRIHRGDIQGALPLFVLHAGTRRGPPAREAGIVPTTVPPTPAPSNANARIATPPA